MHAFVCNKPWVVTADVDIDIKALIAEAAADPVIPEAWHRNLKGMEPGPQLKPFYSKKAWVTWRRAARTVVTHARELLTLNVHRGIILRMLEPYVHVDTLVTATDWDGLDNLGNLGMNMRITIINSAPERLREGWYHLPRLTEPVESWDDAIRIASAKCGSEEHIATPAEGRYGYFEGWACQSRLKI